MSAAPIDLPRWADTALVPLVSVAAALIVAGLVVIGIGENPLEATALLLRGALGSAEGIGFTLYYTTNFIFTGLAVAVAFHAGLFNIGGEGQATVAGIFAALACTALSAMPGSSIPTTGSSAGNWLRSNWSTPAPTENAVFTRRSVPVAARAADTPRRQGRRHPARSGTATPAPAAQRPPPIARRALRLPCRRCSPAGSQNSPTGASGLPSISRS